MSTPALIATSPLEQTVKNLLSPIISVHQTEIPEATPSSDDSDDANSISTTRSSTSLATTLVTSEDEAIESDDKKKTASVTVLPALDEKFKDESLIAYEELPTWFQDNSHITHGYRRMNASWRASFRSLTYLHNESVNIYSHLVPGLAFVMLQIALGIWMSKTYPDAVFGDYFALATFMLSATICLIFSASYHTFMCHSETVNLFWLGMDFIGIIVLTEGMFISGIWVVFRCNATERIIYWSTNVAFGAVAIMILMNRRFRGPRWRTFRMGTFVLTGGSGALPIIHGFIKFGGTQMTRLGVYHFLGEALLLLAGVALYGSRMPESLTMVKRGRFNIWGSSHQLFHFFVVAAVVVHLLGLLYSLDYNLTRRVC